MRPKDAGTGTSISVLTVDETGIVAVGVVQNRVEEVCAASAWPLSVSSTLPAPLTWMDWSVTGAVKAFVISRS